MVLRRPGGAGTRAVSSELCVLCAVCCVLCDVCSSAPNFTACGYRDSASIGFTNHSFVDAEFQNYKGLQIRVGR